MDGNVVGINSAIYSPSGGSVGIGFAIPSNLARQVVGQLRQFGSARRGWLGVNIQQVTIDLAEGLGLASTAGALVADVTAGGPAAKGGLQNGDLITGFDGKPVSDDRALKRSVANTTIGKTVNVDILRKGRKQTIRIAIAKLPDVPTKPLPKAAAAAQPQSKSKVAQLGLTLVALDGNARSQFKLGGNIKGVLIAEVSPDSPAAERSLKPGDVIVQVQGQAVNTPDDVAKKIDADVRAGRKVETLLINSGGAVAYVALRLN
jgi:serine protease Do